MRRGEVWRRSATHYLIVSGDFYHQTFADRVVTVRIHLADPDRQRHPYSVAITTPVPGFVLPDLIEWLSADSVSGGTLLGRLDEQAMAAVERILRGVLELP